jgi:hypothetical protein
LPKVIIEDNRIDSGNTNGTIRGIEKAKNFMIISKSKSFPASSAMNNQTV